MPITITQTADMPDGGAKLIAPTAPVGAEMRVARLDKGAPRYLDPRQTGAAAWGAADVWFRPQTSDDGALVMGPEVTWHLKPHMPYAVSFRGPDGVVVEDRMVWKALRLPSTAPPPSQASGVDLKPEPTPEPDTAIEDDLAAFADVPAAPPIAPVIDERPAQDAKSGSKMWVIAVILLLLIAVGAYFVAFVDPGFMNEETVAEEVVEPDVAVALTEDLKPLAPKPATLAWAREFLQSNPDAATAAAEADRFTAAGEDSAAFLINRFAARQGDAAAALKLGDMYAPDTWKAGVIKAPDAAQALSYYEQAGAEGDVAALEKAIALVESGQGAVTDKAAVLSRLAEALAKAKESQ